MNPLRLRLENYRTFEQLELELPAGCVGVLGLNGHGKSSIVNAIDLALFGPEGRSWAPYLTLGATSTELMVELTFNHADAVYRVRRGYSARGAGKSTLDLERAYLALDAVNDRLYDWEALTLGSAKETQALLEQILGFTRRTLRASSLLLQGEGGKTFTDAEPAERKKVLSDTLGLDRFEGYRDSVRVDRRAAEQAIAQIDGRLLGVTAESLADARATLELTIAGYGEREQAAAAALAAAETKLEQADAALKVEQARTAERATAIASRVQAQAAVDALSKVDQEAEVAARLLATAQQELAGLPAAAETARLHEREVEIVARIDAYRAAVRDRSDALSRVEMATKLRDDTLARAASLTAKGAECRAEATRLEEVGPGDASCDRCGQTLGGEALASTIASLLVQAGDFDDGAKDLAAEAAAIVIVEVPEEPEPTLGDSELAEVRQQIRQSIETATRRGTFEAQIAGYQETTERAASDAHHLALSAARDELEAAVQAVASLGEPSDTATLESAVGIARGRVTLERTNLQAAQQQKAVEQERLSQHAAREEQAGSDLAERARRQSELDLLVIVERAFGPDGIPALIVENAAIPSIEVEANRILTELGGTTAGCRVELRTDREKSGGGVRDDVLDVVVVTDAGERAYETFSGGERTRLNLALRIALARLLATRRGAESRLLAIDEPEFLDEDGTAALVDVLRGLEQQGVFDRIYLVSHVPALRDSFDTTITVVKENDRSRIEGQALPGDEPESMPVAA